MEHTIEISDENSRWHSRDVQYWKGPWEKLLGLIPKFEEGEYRVDKDSPANPYLKNIIRLPLTRLEQPMPIAVVSKSYTLAQHRDVATKCLEGIEAIGISLYELHYELGLSELGEWMNLRIYFPDEFNYTPMDGQKLNLRLECFNSVDGSSRLVILLGWFRFICTNGMIIGKTKTEIREIHNPYMDLEQIPVIISDAMNLIQDEKERLQKWDKQDVPVDQVGKWVNAELTTSWGLKAACRTYHICKNGVDVEITDPFVKANATDKAIEVICEVPGSAKPAKTVYDVSQALSWIASHRNNAEEIIAWQSDIPALLEKLIA